MALHMGKVCRQVGQDLRYYNGQGAHRPHFKVLHHAIAQLGGCAWGAHYIKQSHELPDMNSGGAFRISSALHHSPHKLEQLGCIPVQESGARTKVTPAANSQGAEGGTLKIWLCKNEQCPYNMPSVGTIEIGREGHTSS